MHPVGPELFARLLDEHGGALLLYARQWCDTPEDVVQEAFLRLVREDAVPENVVGWLYRVVRNGAISASRSAARRRRHETAARSDQCWFKPAQGEHLDAQAATRALEQLPAQQREVIVARLWGGLSFDHIARLTGSSTSTAHRHYQAGLAGLRERLGVACQGKSRLKS